MNPPLSTSSLRDPARGARSEEDVDPLPGETAAETPMRHAGRDVFVCYSRADMAVVDRILKELTNRGRTIWIDREGITGSEAWRTKIVESLRCCRAVLFFGSRSSYASKHVATELALAEREQKPIIPVALDDSQPDGEMLFLLVRLHELRVRADDNHRTVSEIETALQNIGLPPAAPEPTHVRRGVKWLPLFGIALGIVCAGGLFFVMPNWPGWYPARITDPPTATPPPQIPVPPPAREFLAACAGFRQRHRSNAAVEPPPES
ncbi:MAG: toll/interleukin-1 receptor domain-containing protein [Verrucomicrobia bacterium]|nr:toll/interleukin-1 receptor domain-containing protein [Verrucomicrobiota bacterium]